MKYILLVLFTAFSISLNAQMSPPTVTRSGTSLTQQDNYLTVAKRLGIPTSATDDLDAAVTAQNSIKLLYNTTLQELRIYNPVTATWASVGGDNIYTTDGEATEFRNATFPDGLVIGRDIDNDLLAFYPGGYEGKNITGLSSGGNMELVTNDTLLLQSSSNEGLIWFSDGALNGVNNLNIKFHELPIIGEVDSLEYIYGEGLDGNLKRIETIYISGGGSSYLAKNGIKIESDTIKLGGNITENTKLDNPNSKSIQIGSDGDAMNLNVVPPFPYSGLISTYSGYDYTSAEYSSFIGILKGLNFAPFGFVNQDMVGTFTIVGNPFDSIYPDGSIMIDGLWEDGGAVAMNKLVFTFLGSDITFNTISMSEIENTEEIEGDNAYQLKSIVGDNGNQTQSIEGNNANQQSIIIGDSAKVSAIINGGDGEISRLIIDSVNNARALEKITSTSYLFYGEKVVGSDTISESNSISPNGFVREFRSGSLTNRDTLNENMYKVEAGNITLKLDSNGLNYGQDYSPFNLSNGVIKYEYSGVTDTLTLKPVYLKINPTFLGFYNKEPILQPILPLGSSTDDVIQVLQNLGLVRED
jgi:hypothetical protein